LRSSNLTG